MLCRCVCVKESMYERESGERKDFRKSLKMPTQKKKNVSGSSVGGALLPLVFLVPFAPKVFFSQLFLPCASFVSFSRCSMFSLVVASG